MTRFDITYEVVTPESAEYGDAEERGFISECVRLRDALSDVRETRTAHVCGVEAIEPSCSRNNFRWISVINGLEFLTGAQETRSLHIPDQVTDASRARILRLLTS